MGNYDSPSRHRKHYCCQILECGNLCDHSYKVIPYVEDLLQNMMFVSLREKNLAVRSEILQLQRNTACVTGSCWLHMNWIEILPILVDADRRYLTRTCAGGLSSVMYMSRTNPSSGIKTWVLAIDSQQIFSCQYWPYESYDWCRDFSLEDVWRISWPKVWEY